MANVSGLQLEAGSIQNAGDIPQSVLDAIREGITNLPPPTKYTKTLEFAGKRKRKADGQHEADPGRKEKKKDKKKVQKKEKEDSLPLSTDEGVLPKKKRKRKKKKRTRRNTQTKPRAKKPEGHAEISVAEKNGSCL